MLELWDMRTYKKFRDIPWDGPKAMEQMDEENFNQTGRGDSPGKDVLDEKEEVS